MNTPQFKVGDQVRDKTGIKDTNGRAVEGTIESSNADGSLTVIARDGHRFYYGGAYVLRPITNLERITRALRLR